MKMKKGILLMACVLLISVFASACGEEKESISVYNWGDYIDKDVLREFEDEYDIKVKYDMFETNEDMYIKLKQGGSSYDVAFPSDYMIERMIREDLLVKLDKENIPNLEKVDDSFLDLDFDPNNDYSVPYMWGTVGIIYNTTMVDEEVDSWDILWDEKYADEIFMLNSQRDTIAVALKKLGYSMNTRDIGELEEAKQAKGY
jgi:spermidine/putrescine transport system substrate-binding protein